MIHSFIPTKHYDSRHHYQPHQINSWIENTNRKANYHTSRRRRRCCYNPGGTQLFWKASSVVVSNDSDISSAIEELLQPLNSNDEDSQSQSQPQQQSLSFLFVDQKFSDDFPTIVKQVYESINNNENYNDVDRQPILLSILGGGVIGNTEEFDSTSSTSPTSNAAISILSGLLPQSATAISYTIETNTNKDNDEIWNKLKQQSTQTTESSSSTLGGSTGSHVVFADPFLDVERVLQEIGNDGNVIIGGISCPKIGNAFAGIFQQAPSIGLNDDVLPAGSAVGVRLDGDFGLQAVVAQGCRPIGPTFTITSASGNVLNTIDDLSAMQQLQNVMQKASDKDKALIQQGGILVGIGSMDTIDPKVKNESEDLLNPQDLLIRQIVGITQAGNGGGAIAIGVNSLKVGDQFQFHIRDAEAAQEDMRIMVQRAKTERLFAGPDVAGKPVAALQISCVARGRGLFGIPNVDVDQVQQLLLGRNSQPQGGKEAKMNTPIAGWFANGEFGPVGISSFGKVVSNTDNNNNKGAFVHGFTTVIGLLCDFSGKYETPTAQQASGLSSDESIGEEAWG